MGTRGHGKEIIPRALKYPLFFIGLFVIIVGTITVSKLGMSLEAEAATAGVGFLILVLGIVLE